MMVLYPEGTTRVSHDNPCISITFFHKVYRIFRVVLREYLKKLMVVETTKGSLTRSERLLEHYTRQ